MVSFRSALLKFLDQPKIITEPWHSGSNGRMSIAGYLPKNVEERYAGKLSNRFRILGGQNEKRQ